MVREAPSWAHKSKKAFSVLEMAFIVFQMRVRNTYGTVTVTYLLQDLHHFLLNLTSKCNKYVTTFCVIIYVNYGHYRKCKDLYTPRKS